MTTPLEIIYQSLKDCGFTGDGETPSDENVNDAFRKLQWMLAEWRQKRGMVYHLVEKTLVMDGAQSYTIGPGAQIDVAQRPNKIDSAVIRQTFVTGSPVDFGVNILQAFEDWQQISVKENSGPPSVIFYDTGWPEGRIYVWPKPQANMYQLRILIKAELESFTSLTQEIVLPPEYESALNWNLALRCTPMTGDLKVDPVVAAEAKASRALILNVNAQTRRLRMPSGIPNRGWYNPISGMWTS